MKRKQDRQSDKLIKSLFDGLSEEDKIKSKLMTFDNLTQEEKKEINEKSKKIIDWVERELDKEEDEK